MHLVDFHSHILPGADHGSHSLKESLEQIALMRENGIETVVATSHFYGHTEMLSTFRNRIENAYNELLAELKKNGWDTPRIYLGAEVLVFAGLENMDGLDTLAIKGTKTLLLELPYTEISNDIFNTVHRILRKGFKVVLAHADRYRKEDIDLLIDMGAKIQLNADALDSFFLKGKYKKWLREGAVVALGSDIHGANAKAYKLFLNAEGKLLKYLDQIRQSTIFLLENAQM